MLTYADVCWHADSDVKEEEEAGRDHMGALSLEDIPGKESRLSVTSAAANAAGALLALVSSSD